jgi:hypothetical protein
LAELYIPASMAASVLVTVQAEASGSYVLAATATERGGSAQASATTTLVVDLPDQPGAERLLTYLPLILRGAEGGLPPAHQQTVYLPLVYR